MHATIDGDFDGNSEGPGTTPEFDPNTGVGLALGYTAGRFSLEGFLESTTFDDVDHEGFGVEHGELESLGLRAIVGLGPRDASRRWKPFVHVGVARSTHTLVDDPDADAGRDAVLLGLVLRF